MKKLLLAEDDPNLGVLTREFLAVKGFDVTLAENGKLAYDEYKKKGYNLLLLDVMMPEMDGFTLAREIRKTDKKTPIIFLTAKSMQQDTLEGFTIGADDYVTKPFSMEELIMRIHAVLKRAEPEPETPAEYPIGRFVFTPSRQELRIADNVVKLSTRESELLQLLCNHQNQTLERGFALEQIWNVPSKLNSRNMDVYIAKLRKILSEDPSIEILNLHGKGFKLVVK